MSAGECQTTNRGDYDEVSMGERAIQRASENEAIRRRMNYHLISVVSSYKPYVVLIVLVVVHRKRKMSPHHL